MLVVEKAHAARKEAGIRVRQPLDALTVTGIEISDELIELVKDELNVKSVKASNGKDLAVDLDTVLTPTLVEEGRARDLVRDIQSARKEAGLTPTQKVKVQLPDWPADFEDMIKDKTGATELVRGSELQILLT